MIKILNLYAGIGGNRKLWKDCKVTAVENNKEIARIYKDNFPKDKIIICDAHEFLLKNFKKFDFIWSSPPCQSHSVMRKNVSVPRGQSKPIYPDMNLYQEIIFLTYFCKSKWVVENVIGYYDPLIQPQNSGGHYFWGNFMITWKKPVPRGMEFGNNESYEKLTGFKLKGYKLGKRKDQVYHNCINPELGLHILNCALKEQQKTLKEI